MKAALLLIALVVTGIFGLIIYVFWRPFIASKIKKSSTVNIPDDRCVACNSKDITTIFDNAYECNACGYKGGSGLKEKQDNQRLDFVRKMDQQERKQWALQTLDSAAALLLACEGDVKGAMQYSKNGSQDRMDEVNEKQMAITSLMQNYGEAMQLIMDAEYGMHLAEDSVYNGDDINIDYTLWARDVQFNFVWDDMLMHKKIKKLAELIQKATEHVNRRLAENY